MKGWVVLILAAIWSTLAIYDFLRERDDPAEPVALEDRSVLGKELDQVIASTAALGTWGEQRARVQSGLRVSANLQTAKSEMTANASIVQALWRNGWQDLPQSSDGSLRLCKGRYRASIARVPNGSISLGMSVKDRQRQRDC